VLGRSDYSRQEFDGGRARIDEAVTWWAVAFFAELETKFFA